MAQVQVFVSHSHQDMAFCQTLVTALRDAGADVWFDESDLGAWHVRRVIMQELVRRPIFVVVLSKAAFASQWVMDECDWAYDLQKDEPSRIFLPVVAEPLERADFNAMLYLYGLKRIEAPGMRPYPTDEAIRHMLHALTLTPRDKMPAPPQPGESATDLLKRGNNLIDKKRYIDALPLLVRATQVDSSAFGAWYTLGQLLNKLGHYDDAFRALEQAVTLMPQFWPAWNFKGDALVGLKRYSEALDSYDHALTLEPTFALAHINRARTLLELGRTDEAYAAARRAQELGG